MRAVLELEPGWNWAEDLARWLGTDAGEGMGRSQRSGHMLPGMPGQYCTQEMEEKNLNSTDNQTDRGQASPI